MKRALGCAPAPARAPRPFWGTRWVLACVLAAGGAGCKDEEDGENPSFFVEEVGLKVPKLSGWIPDPELSVGDLDDGGTALRLVRENAAPGSPKISVEVGKAGTGTTLGAFLNQSLKAMGDLETQGSMRITRVNQQQLRLGQRRGHLVAHEFTMGTGEVSLAFTQRSTLLVIDGRGVAVTAVGRDELFRPLADQIHRILTGLQVTIDPDSGDKEPPKQIKVQEVKPVDLGTVGGK